MGKSYVWYRGQDFCARDFLLEIWYRYLALQLDKGDTPRTHWIHGFRADLFIASSGVFVGLIPSYLDEYLTEENRVATVVAASNRTIARFKAIGASIPAAFLNALRSDDMVGGNIPTEWIEEIHIAFNDLLLGRLDQAAMRGVTLPGAISRKVALVDQPSENFQGGKPVKPKQGL